VPCANSGAGRASLSMSGARRGSTAMTRQGSSTPPKSWSSGPRPRARNPAPWAHRAFRCCGHSGPNRPVPAGDRRRDQAAGGHGDYLRHAPAEPGRLARRAGDECILVPGFNPRASTESEQERGTTFQDSIPLSEAEPAAQRPIEPSLRRLSGSNCRERKLLMNK
jgi:hypothetical protein